MHTAQFPPDLLILAPGARVIYLFFCFVTQKIKYMVLDLVTAAFGLSVASADSKINVNYHHILSFHHQSCHLSAWTGQ